VALLDVWIVWALAAREHPDAPHPLALLRARRPRPCERRAAKKRDEFPPPHGAYPKAKDHKLIIAPCIAAKSGHSSPVEVSSGGFGLCEECPVYPCKRRQSRHSLTSPRCQRRT